MATRDDYRVVCIGKRQGPAPWSRRSSHKMQAAYTVTHIPSGRLIHWTKWLDLRGVEEQIKLDIDYRQSLITMQVEG